MTENDYWTYHLPALSEHIRVLTAEESDRLNKKDPYLPKDTAHCITCGGRKQFRWWVPNADRHNTENIVTYKCECAEQFILFKYLLNCGVPLNLQRYNLEDMTSVDREVIAAIYDYVYDSDYFLNQGYGFIFSGARGTGKTVLAASMLKLLLDKGVDGYYTTFNDMLDAFTAGWNDDADKRWFDQKIKMAPLLVIDDIGKEYAGRLGVSSVAIDNVFRARVQASKPTIITTNLSDEEMGQKYSAALETIAGKSRRFDFTGNSWRSSGEEDQRAYNEMKMHLTRPIMIR